MSNELLSVISYLERDRGVNREIIIQAIESAIQQAARKSLDVSNDLRVEIDRKTLTIKAFDTVVVSEEESGAGFLSLRRARALKRDVQPGDTLSQIAAWYGISVDYLCEVNELWNPNMIYVGQVLIIP